LQSYETKDGETRTDLVVRAISVTLMGGGEAAAEDAQETEQNEEQEVADEDIPF